MVTRYSVLGVVAVAWAAFAILYAVSEVTHGRWGEVLTCALSAAACLLTAGVSVMSWQDSR